jgi:hypothetical protein
MSHEQHRNQTRRRSSLALCLLQAEPKSRRKRKSNTRGKYSIKIFKSKEEYIECHKIAPVDEMMRPTSYHVYVSEMWILRWSKMGSRRQDEESEPSIREPERAPLGAKMASQCMLRLTLRCAQVAQAELRLKRQLLTSKH